MFFLQPLAPQPKTATKVAGESLVWLTALGLSVALLMEIGLLGLIFANGMAVFWPKRVVQLEVKDGARTVVWGGEIAKEQQRQAADGKLHDELQLYVANKDAYGGATYRFVDKAAITAVTQPDQVMAVERMEYGNAFGLPQELRIKGEPAVPASDPAFNTRLRQLIDEVHARWAQIQNLEQGEIGANSRRIQAAQIRLRELGPAGEPAAVAAVTAELKQLNDRGVALTVQTRELRAHQNDHVLALKLMSGEARTIPLGKIVDFHYPNQLGFFARCGHFVANLFGFITEQPREANTEGGIFPAIFGTFVMTLLMSMAVTPFGVLAAIYLREYARQGPLVRGVRIAINNLAGVPSIVFGVFGLGFFVYFIGGHVDQWLFSGKLPAPTFGTGGILWSALTLALMTVPVVIVATEEAVAAVPRGMREGSLACGASKWQTIQRIVLPASVPGILTGLILAMARGAGEVAPLMLVGVVKLAPKMPIDGIFPFVHLDYKFMHLGFHIFDLGFQSPDSEAAKPMVFATTLFLIGLVLCLNLGAVIIREKLRRRFATGAF